MRISIAAGRPEIFCPAYIHGQKQPVKKTPFFYLSHSVRAEFITLAVVFAYHVEAYKYSRSEKLFQEFIIPAEIAVPYHYFLRRYPARQEILRLRYLLYPAAGVCGYDCAGPACGDAHPFPGFQLLFVRPVKAPCDLADDPGFHAAVRYPFCPLAHRLFGDIRL